MITGLFLLWPSSKHQLATEPSKPSHYDFTSGNHPEKKSLQEAPNPQLPKPSKLVAKSLISAEDQKKWQLFQAAIESKNDNDPRIDSDLADLSPEMHENLRQAYEALAAENRNGRGLVAFLIARDLKSPEDVDFLKKIYQESPCLSFSNCATEAPPDPHLDGINQTSLNYPQLAGLYQLERKLEAQPEMLGNAEMRARLSAMLREARQFPADAVQKRAEQIQSRYGL